MTTSARSPACATAMISAVSGPMAGNQLEDAGGDAHRHRVRHPEQHEAADAHAADDQARRGLRAHIPGERAVHVTQVFLAAPLEVAARQHSQGRTLEAGRAGQQQEREERRDRQPRGIRRRRKQVVERLPRLALDVARSRDRRDATARCARGRAAARARSSGVSGVNSPPRNRWSTASGAVTCTQCDTRSRGGAPRERRPGTNITT